MNQEKESQVDRAPVERGAADLPVGSDYPTSRAGQTLDQRRILSERQRTLELQKERLVAHKELRQVGEILIRKQVEEVPGRLVVDAYREEVDVEHVPVGQVVSERKAAWRENGTLVVPVYEEQVVAVKRLVLREYLKVRRVATTTEQVFEEPLRRERIVVEDPNHTGLVRQIFPDNDNRTRPAADQRGPEAEPEQASMSEPEREGFFERLLHKVLL